MTVTNRSSCTVVLTNESQAELNFLNHKLVLLHAVFLFSDFVIMFKGNNLDFYIGSNQALHLFSTFLLL